jgi:general secretion pathway protein A
MYDDFYRLSGKPFQLSPNPRFFFGSSGHQKALCYLQYGLHRGEGFVVITGDVGTGKTTLIAHLFGQLNSANYLAAKLVTTQLEADDTLRMVAAKLGIETRGVAKSSLLRDLEHFLLENQRLGRRTLIVIDEAQNLPMKSLEELRMLSNFQSDEGVPVQFCLVGQPQFRDMLARDDLLQLRQRVVAAYHLGPLRVEETKAYIEHRLLLVGWQSDPVITEGAYGKIHHFAGGIPRQINVLCDRLLLCGVLENLHEIDGTVVDSVAGEMSMEGLRTKIDLADSNAAVKEPGPAAPNEGPDFERRLSSLEALVGIHDRTIKRALGLAASYLNRQTARTPAEAPEPEQSLNDAST